ncbi:hypothetical protein SynBIOSE41_02578 [Synechococcus sp. BIOS-E4-1]|nr:hypothetical protein SynBIOSE41_02578 [Synechococcus sp. BIOS-E4-1]
MDPLVYPEDSSINRASTPPDFSANQTEIRGSQQQQMT